MSRSLQLLRLIGAVCLIYILSTLDYARLWQALRAVDARYLVLACGVNLLAGALKAYRWKVLVAAQSGFLSFGRCFFVHAYLAFVANITPGRIGELFKMKYLREAGFGTVRAVTNLVLDRASDLVMMACLGLLAAGLQAELRLDYGLLAGLALLGLASLALLRVSYGALLKRLDPKRQDLVAGLVGEVRDLDLPRFAFSVLVTLAAVVTVQLQIYLIALGLGVTADFWTFLPIMLAANLVALLPLSVSGLGTREFVLITLLGRHGVSPEVAALVSLIDVFLVAYAFRGVLALTIWTFKRQLLPEPV